MLYRLTVVLLFAFALPLCAQQYPDRHVHQESPDNGVANPWDANAAPAVSSSNVRRNHDASVYAPELSVPDDARAAYEHGLQSLADNKPADAERDFRHAAALYPKYSSAYNGLAIALRRLNRIDEAQTSLARALELNPNNAPAQKNLASIFIEQGKFAEAERLQRRATVLQPHDPAGFVTLAYLGVLLKHYDEAITASEAIEKKQWKKFPVIRLIRATAYENKGDRRDAIQEYKAFLKTKPDQPHTLLAQKAIQRLKQKKF